MKLKIFLLLLAMLAIRPLMAQDTYNQIDEMGNVTQRNQNFNKHNNDTTSSNKEVPKGLKTWTVDRKFGNVIPTEPDTLDHLFPQSLFNTGRPMKNLLTGETADGAFTLPPYGAAVLEL